MLPHGTVAEVCGQPIVPASPRVGHASGKAAAAAAGASQRSRNSRKPWPATAGHQVDIGLDRCGYVFGAFRAVTFAR